MDLPVLVRPLAEGDVDEVDRVMRLAFGTYLGLAEPASFAGDAELVRCRASAPNTVAFVAESDGRIVGSSFVARSGSFALFGPLTVHPSRWDAGIGRRLMEPIVDQLADWAVTLAGLFTFPDSVKHVGLYQRFGFYPRALTALMNKPVTSAAAPNGTTRLSQLPPHERARALGSAARVTSQLLDGWDLTDEAEHALAAGVGEVITAHRGTESVGVAVCHTGPGSEAGTGTAYVKVAAVRPGAHAAADFATLVDACEAWAADAGAQTLLTGVNTAREQAYTEMLRRGYRVGRFGLAMHRPNLPGFSGSGDYVLDDWR